MEEYILCFGSIIVGSLILGFFFRLNSREKQKAWQTFAQRNRLDFSPGFFLIGDSIVTGTYRGHKVSLTLVYYDRQAYTRLTVRPGPVSEEAALALSIRPTVEDLHRLFIPAGGFSLKRSSLEMKRGEDEIRAEEADLVTDLDRLQFLLETVCNVADLSPALIERGGQAVPPLQEIATQPGPLRRLAGQLLQEIGEDTTTRLRVRADQLFCPDCLTICGAHEIAVSLWQSPNFWQGVIKGGHISYYGCRSCGQSVHLWECPAGAVAVLDRDWADDLALTGGELRVNWLRRRELFDFDRVEIIQAGDEAVERFAVQVGNDTDPLRHSRYGEIPCLISSTCRLSANTERILARMFGEVRIADS